MAIKYCPNCRGILKDKTNLAQHVKECDDCKARYFTIETTSPKIEINTYYEAKKPYPDIYYDNLNRRYNADKSLEDKNNRYKDLEKN